MNYRDLWIINNDIFKKVLVKKYHKSNAIVIELHEKVANAID
jgi:hypothetical protein